MRSVLCPKWIVSAGPQLGSALAVPAHLGEHFCSVVDTAYSLGQAVSRGERGGWRVIAAGMSTTVASSRKSGMPSKRARTDA